MEVESLKAHDLEELLSALPACRRCRLNKRRCDTQLPSCRNCSKAGIECMFFDHVLKETLPRSYVFTLLQRLKAQSENRKPTDESSFQRRPVQSTSPSSTESRPAPQSSRYIGNLSCISTSLSKIKFVREQVQRGLVLPPVHIAEPDCSLNQEIHEYLVTTYLNDIHCIYPFLDESLPFFLPEWAMDSNLSGLNPRERFSLELIYSISCHHILDNAITDHQRFYFSTLSKKSNHRGLMFFDRAASDVSIGTLQSITLAALHSLFAPHQGNCGQLIGLAVRLAIDLNIGDRPNSLSVEQTKLQQTYMSIYCIENQLATALDRPNLLPELPDIQQIDASHPHHSFYALYRIQSRFRHSSNDPEVVVSFLHQLAEHTTYLGGQPTQIRHNLFALALETRLLLQPDDENSASRLLDLYVQPHYVRTIVSPQWAYKAGVTIASKGSQLGAQPQPGSDFQWSDQAFQAYGHCLIFLEQCSRRWPSAGTLKQALQSSISKPWG